MYPLILIPISIFLVVAAVVTIMKLKAKRANKALQEKKAHSARLYDIVSAARREARESDGDFDAILNSKLTPQEQEMKAESINNMRRELEFDRKARNSVFADMAAATRAWTDVTSLGDRFAAGVDFVGIYRQFSESSHHRPYLKTADAALDEEIRTTLQQIMQDYFDNLLRQAPDSKEAFDNLVVLLDKNAQHANYLKKRDHQACFVTTSLPDFLKPLGRPANWRHLVGTHCENPALSNYMGDILNKEKQAGEALLRAVQAIRDEDHITAKWLLAHCSNPFWRLEIDKLRPELATVSVNYTNRTNQST